MEARSTRQVVVGDVPIGGGAPVVVQSMTNTRTADVEATLAQVERLAAAGCEIVRVAVPDRDAVGPFAEIVKGASVPIVADVHFDYRLAIAAIENGAAKVRVNPGNIRGEDRFAAVLDAARAAGIPVRIGVNAGSLEKDILEKHGHPTSAALAESALRWIAFCDERAFRDIVVSAKASSARETVDVNRLLAAGTDVPIHIGVTEAGTPAYGVVKSAVALGVLLMEGTGDTLRVSLAGDPVLEVEAAYRILRAAGARIVSPEVIACPTCGRTDIDVAAIATEVERQIADIRAPLTVAVMGCVVNGPGEAREADVGIAGGRGEGLLFRNGETVRKVSEAEIVEVLVAEVRRLAEEGR